MALTEEEPRRRPAAYQLGQDVSLLSVDELTARIGELEAEIVRLKAERDRRGATRSAAEQLFRR